VPLVAGARLPLAFIVFGLAGLAASAGWMALEPSLVGLPHLHPRVVALVHLWLPCFLLSVCVGALYQLMPVVLGAPLSTRVSVLWIHFVMHAFGAVMIVVAFAHGRFEWVGAGGILVAVGVMILCIAVLRTFLASKRRDAPAWCFPLATGWLAATVLFGIVLATNRRWPWLPLSAADLLRAHAHLGLAGFFLTLLQGTTFQLIPMFTMGSLRRPRFVWAGLSATQAGLLTLTPGLAWDLPILIRGGALILAGGVVCSAIALRATLNSRRRRILEPGLRAFVLGAGILGLVAIVGVALAFMPVGHAMARQGIALYGIMMIPGALSLAVLGMLCKIIPFLVWMRAYGPKVGKQPVPLATALASRALEQSWLITHLAGLGLLFTASALASDKIALSGGIALLVATGLFLANVWRVLAHLRPRAIAPLPSPEVPARSL
jgi:hypothetical protein